MCSRVFVIFKSGECRPLACTWFLNIHIAFVWEVGVLVCVYVHAHVHVHPQAIKHHSCETKPE